MIKDERHHVGFLEAVGILVAQSCLSCVSADGLMAPLLSRIGEDFKTDWDASSSAAARFVSHRSSALSWRRPRFRLL